MTLKTGQKIGKYEVVSQLGQGGMGSVYKGKDTSIGIEVAIKEVDSQIAQHPDGIASFKAEVKLAIQLRHPNIVGFVGYEEVPAKGGKPAALYLITQLVEGKTLQEYMEMRRASGQNLNPTETLHIMGQICAGLHYAHSRGVVHRDIKPHNIMYEETTRIATIIDFGIARTNTNTALGGKTQHLAAGAFSAFYSAPEQVLKLGTTARSDIYSCGVMAYEMLTGKMMSVYPQQSQSRLINETVTRLPFVSPQVEDVLLRATAVKADFRQLTMAEFSADLEQAINNSGSVLPPSSFTPPTPPSSGPGPTTTQPRTKFDIRK
jgi:serine/threonine protein kinase